MFDWWLQRLDSLLEIARGKKLTDAHYHMFKQKEIGNEEDLYHAYRELNVFLQNHEYYDTIDRIEKGEAYLAEQTDPHQQKRARDRLDVLYAKLSELEARGVAA